VYLTCSKKLTDSQLSPPQGTNEKLKCENKNKTMSVIGDDLFKLPAVFKAHKLSLKAEVWVNDGAQ